MKTKIDTMVACIILSSSLARIVFHLCAFKKGKENWDRAKAGIKREFVFHLM